MRRSSDRSRNSLRESEVYGASYGLVHLEDSSRMLKKSASGVLNTREAYLARILPPSLQRETNGASRTTDDEDGLFEHPAWRTPVIPDVQTSEIPACLQSFSAAC